MASTCQILMHSKYKVAISNLFQSPFNHTDDNPLSLHRPFLSKPHIFSLHLPLNLFFD